MTVSTNISSVRYQGNGVTNTFSFNGRIFTNSDLSVDIITRSTDAVVETLAPSDYTVSLVSSESAEIVVVGPKIPSASQDILIYRNIDINQSLRLPTGTVFPASDVESALDRLTTIIQDSQDDGSRSLVFPKNISGITTPYLPSPEDGKLLVWDGETGNVANLSITNLIDEGFDTVFTSLIATDFLQYDGVSWVNIHNSDFPLQSIKAPTSSGIVLKNNSGTAILTIGSGGASSATFAGTLNIPDGTVSTTAKLADGIITLPKIAAGYGLVPSGAVTGFAMSTVPSGWLECNGAAVSRTTYASLFAAIGTMYGVGDGSTTFNLPDYQGIFHRGWDHGRGVDPDSASRTNRGDGTTGDAVGTRQLDAFKSHNHTFNGFNGSTASGQTGTSSSTLNGASTSFSGGNETRPRNVYIMYCIKI